MNLSGTAFIKEIAKFGVSITYVLVHMQRKRKQSFERFIRHQGVIGLLFLLKFPLSEVGPVWNLELPNLEAKAAVFFYRIFQPTK